MKEFNAVVVSVVNIHVFLCIIRGTMKKGKRKMEKDTE